MKRREFMQDVLAASLGLAAAGKTGTVSAAVPALKKEGPWVCVFTKHLAFLDYPALAKTLREIQLDGADLTVRKGGHVLPENVRRDLPKATEILRAEGVEVPMITTAFTSAQDDHVREVLETASGLGIRYFRVGGLQYDAEGPILPQLDKALEKLRSLAALATECKMTAGYHNHSGFNQIGGPVWDLHTLIQSIDSPNFGSNFDVGHAVVEGAFGDWQITARLMAPQVKMMAVKDFIFPEKSLKPQWVPLGEGVVPVVKMLKIMRAADFRGPISLHFEDKVFGNVSQPEKIAMIGDAAKKVRSYLSEAGY